MSSNNNTSEEQSPGSEVYHNIAQPLSRLSAAQSSQIIINQDLLDLLLAIAQKKRLIALRTLVGGVLSAIVAFFIPNSYTATAIVMPPQQSQSSANALLGQISGLAGMAGGAAGALGIKSPGDLYIGLLGSRSISDAVIDKLDLKRVYAKKTQTAARIALTDHRKFSSGKDSLIHIEASARDPKLAAQIANAYVVALNAKNASIAFSEARRKRVFLEKRLGEERLALADAEDAMKSLEQRSGVIQVEGQARLTIGAVAQLKAQIAAQEVTLGRIRMGATPQNPEVVNAEAELSALQRQLKQLENSNEATSLGDPLLPASRLPTVGLAYLRQLREMKFHEFLFDLLTKQYEAAHLDEIKDAPELPVVDWAEPPEVKSGPKRRIILALGLLVSAILSCAIVCLSFMLQKVNADGKLTRLRVALRAEH